LTALPTPDPQALQTSEQLCALIARNIERAGGWISFDRYMQLALYEPGLGYYAGGRHPFGAGGDFVTAPELSPVFARCLAVQVADWLHESTAQVWEFGAGSGALAAELLNALDDLGVDHCEYNIVEVSAALAQQQQALVAERAPGALARVRWLTQLPPDIRGVVLGNEVLDAMPVRCFMRREGQILERGVIWFAQEQRFAFAPRPADTRFASLAQQALASSGWPMQAFANDYSAELGEQASAWTSSVAARLQEGVMLLIDYGFPAAEFYHPQRGGGTLRCHYRHHSHDDPFWLPGLSDITAHVDFTAVHRAASEQSLRCLGFTSQANFLLSCDFAAQFQHLSARATDDSARARLAQSAGLLVSEAEMGELFKAIAFSRGDGFSARGFARRDRQQSLI
jgi:SAM-dependent MidA family methyltransferase